MVEWAGRQRKTRCDDKGFEISNPESLDPRSARQSINRTGWQMCVCIRSGNVVEELRLLVD